MHFDPVFTKSVADLTMGGGVILAPIPFTIPSEGHPITQYFTQSGRRMAAGIEYAVSGFGRVHRYYSVERPLLPPYCYADELPYPVGWRDANGAGLIHPFTPLGYLLWHDHRAQNARFDALGADPPAGVIRELTVAHLLHHGKIASRAAVHQRAKQVILVDPPAEVVVKVLAPPKALVPGMTTTITDFQHHWNCGAWFDPNSPKNTTKALRTLFCL